MRWVWAMRMAWPAFLRIDIAVLFYPVILGCKS
uniref:Uncharacterized protein n=1 Tax=Podoviridae sp. ctz6O13 TaxID=2827757 RepID=A0A8S5TKI9_9CAUD|nr:MAG TPA: hypothetical protein [Podoviridae sp. ctz6O13]